MSESPMTKYIEPFGSPREYHGILKFYLTLMQFECAQTIRQVSKVFPEKLQPYVGRTHSIDPSYSVEIPQWFL